MLALDYGDQIEVKRIALSRAQVNEYDPPPNPAKVTDSRYRDYSILHGDESWELDALEPKVLVDLITETVGGFIDWDKWDEDYEREQEERAALAEVANNF
jgi:hypothetical protein